MHIDFGGERHELPRGAVIGVIGDDTSGVSELLQAAGGRFLGPGQAPDFSPAPLICIAYQFDVRDLFSRLSIDPALEPLRRAGSTVLLASHDQDLLRRCSDEVWWVSAGRIALKGDERQVLPAYNRHTAQRLKGAAAEAELAVSPTLRRGDGRARVTALELLDENGTAAGAVLSGSETTIRVRVQFEQPVSDPVIGIMIRTRIGMEVYGTNTELENVQVGPCQAGDVRTVLFRFNCDLCPGSYTITAASHDPDGVWHDWLEDAVVFPVADSRYTAGVANLRASVTCCRE